MTLTDGTRLGPYEVIAPIGAGGMGEVYKAKDTRLDRTVAIKVLPSHLADNPNLKLRFEREARAVSSLNHPHICTLHDVGEQDGTDFLVMEYIEGETLADRLKKGALPLDQALRHAIEIADALDKAHRQGVVHRDLKPGNIMLTKSGAKLLDFGLAKLRTDVSAETSSLFSALPTEEKPLTREGSILGTFQYMAPEQLEGGDADARADVFAFGSVLYEMVTGQRAFEGKSQASLVSAIMSADPPPIRSLEPLTPLSLDKTVRTCLEKDPDERWQSFTDLKRELLWIVEGEVVSEKPLPAARKRRLAWVAGTLAAMAATGTIIWNLKAPEPPRVSHLRMSLEPAERLRSIGQFNRPARTAFALSPDGRNIVFSGQAGNRAQLYRRALDQERAVPIPGTEDGVGPFFSPDGQWVGFFASGLLKKVSLSGGTVTTVCDTSANNIYGASWGDDGFIVFALWDSELFRVNAAGGDAEPLTTPDSDSDMRSHRLPHALPGSRAVLFTIASSTATGGTSKLAVKALGTDGYHILTDGGSDARYLRTGHVAYVKSGTLMVAPFDSARLVLTGPSVPVLEQVMHASGSTTPLLETIAAQFDVSNDGTLVYLPGGTYPEERRFLTWVDRNGNEERLDLPLRHYLTPRLSPDGRRLSVNAGGGFNLGAFLIDPIRGTTTRLTPAGEAGFPIWTPDGKRVCFGMLAGGSGWKMANMGGDIEPLTVSKYWHVPSSWTPDGKTFAYVEFSQNTGRDIWLLDVNTGDGPRPLMQTPANEQYPEFSPNGRWLAYVSNESGQNEVNVQPFPEAREKYQISTDGGFSPLWSKDGTQLFYRKDKQVLAVSIETNSGFVAGRPEVLFEGDYQVSFPARSYDISNDGKRFLMIGKEPFPDTPITQFHIVLNWFEELKRLVPTEN